MKLRFFPLSLRFTVPLLLFCLSGVVGAWSFYQQMSVANRRAEEQVRWEARSTGTRVTGLMEYLFRRTETDGSEIEGSELLVRQLVSDPNVKLAVMVDDGDRVLVATDRTLEQQAIGQTALVSFVPQLVRVRQKLAGQLSLSADGRELMALYPFYLRSRAGELRSTRVGVLLVQYDLSGQQQLAMRETMTGFLRTMPVLAGLCVLVWLLFEQILTRRAARLVAVSQRFAAGELTARIGLRGSDELARISGAFDRMADQVQQNTETLRCSELQLRLRSTELEQTLWQLQEAQAQLIQTEKMSSLGQLVAGIAHEINNPVNFIHGNLSYADDYAASLLRLLRLYQVECPVPSAQLAAALKEVELDFVAEDFPKILVSMKMGTARIREIVLSLRNFSRLDESEMKPVDIHEGIESTLLILQSRLKADGDRPEIEVNKFYGELPLVECYAGQLNQVLMNLLANAIDALEEKFVRLRQQGVEYPVESNRVALADPLVDQPVSLKILIETELVAVAEAAGKVVRISIADNALGIPDAVRQQIFNPFFTTKPVGRGTGLGLSISYKIIVDRHRGSLRCDSKPNEGTRFAIEIPVLQCKEF